MAEFKINLISPPDQELVTTEVIVDAEQWCELQAEHGSLVVEFYSRESGEPWTLPYDACVDALDRAKARLVLALGPEVDRSA